MHVYRVVVRVRWNSVGKDHFVNLRNCVTSDLTEKFLPPQPPSPALEGMNFPVPQSEHINYTYGEGISECG